MFPLFSLSTFLGGWLPRTSQHSSSFLPLISFQFLFYFISFTPLLPESSLHNYPMAIKYVNLIPNRFWSETLKWKGLKSFIPVPVFFYHICSRKIGIIKNAEHWIFYAKQRPTKSQKRNNDPFFNWQLPTHLVGLKPKTSLINALLWMEKMSFEQERSKEQQWNDIMTVSHNCSSVTSVVFSEHSSSVVNLTSLLHENLCFCH